MVASTIFEEVFLMVKTTIVAMLLGLSVAVTGPALGVTDPTPAVQAVEEKAAAEGEKVGVGAKIGGWFKTKKDAIAAASSAAYDSLTDPEAKNVALKAEVKELRALLQKRDAELTVKKVGSSVEIDTLMGCALDLQSFLKSLEPK